MQWTKPTILRKKKGDQGPDNERNGIRLWRKW